MALQKLQNADAFVVRDLDTETPAIGIVRSAPKILQSGAKELARSQTYACAALNMKMQGASAGVNAAPDVRDDVLAAVCEELLGAVESGALMLDPAKGVADSQLATLSAADNRSDARLRDVDGIPNLVHLGGTGAVAAAAAVRPLDGLRIAIENFDSMGLAVARAASAQGATIVALSTSAGTAQSDDGFALDDVAAALASDGPAMIGSLSDDELPAWRVLGADVDVLFAGSKMGLIDHRGAPNVKATLVVPTGPIPYTTKGALMLERQGTVVLPDFITTAGGLLAGFPPDGNDDQEALETAVTDRITSLVESVSGKDAGPILEACYAAESFLTTWRDELPFGRPFAA